MALINSIGSSDEEGQSRQQMLKFAAKRYSSVIERNPDDYDALYNWALVLQESADNVNSNTNSSSKDSLLEEACKKLIITGLLPYLTGRTKEAEELWKQAAKKYEKAVQLNWNSPRLSTTGDLLYRN